MRQRIGTWCLAFGLLGLAACGGNVIVETTTGGEGGSGASDPGNSVGGGAAQTICDKFCNLSEAFNCDQGGGECAPSCLEAFSVVPDECKDEYAAFIQCVIDSMPQTGCDFETVCTSELLVLGTCLSGGPGPGPGPGPGCDDAECLGSETSCSCKGVCDGQVRAMECTLDGNQYSCTCYDESGPIATCVDPSNTCDLEVGCCAFYFGEGV